MNAQKMKGRFPASALRVVLAFFAVGLANPWVHEIRAQFCSNTQPWGDINQSGKLNVADVQCLLLTMLGDDVPGCLVNSADLTCNGSVDVLDLQWLLLRAFSAPAGSPCDIDADGCPDLCVKKVQETCRIFCVISGTKDAVVYCPLRMVGGSCCYDGTWVSYMFMTLTYDKNLVSPIVGIYEHGCNNQPQSCKPKTLPYINNKYYYWPGLSIVGPTLAFTHQVWTDPPVLSQAQGSFTLWMVPLIGQTNFDAPISIAKFDNWGTIAGNDEILGIGFKLLKNISSAAPANVCLTASVVDTAAGWVPVTSPFVNPDHILVWGTSACGCEPNCTE